MSEDATRAERRAELVAAALSGELTTAETRELAELREADPTVDAELDELRDVIARLGTIGAWTEADDAEGADAAVERAVAAATRHDATGEGPRSGSSRGGRGPVGAARRAGSDRPAGRPTTGPALHHRARARRRWPLVLGGAGCAAVGLVAGLLLPTGPAEVTGPPGTLGAVEDVDFTGEPSGVSVEGDLVAHTWGTETMLTIDGLPAGESYEVVVIDTAGAEVGSGTFVGSDVTIECVMNAATMRDAVVSVVIRDVDGATVASAEAPPVEA